MPATPFDVVETDTGYETHWENGLKIDGVEILEIEDYDIGQYFCALYELTYKYDQIDLHEFDGDKVDVLAIAEAGIRDSAGRIIEMLKPVFSQWLESHAITDPKKWGMARVALLEEGVSPREWLEAAVSEYSSLMSRLEGRLWSQSVSEWYRNRSFRELPDHLDEMPALRGAAKAFVDEMYEMDMENWREGDLDEKPVKPDVDEAFEYGFLDDLSSLEYMDDPSRIVAEIFAEMVFPVWYMRWESEGISATRLRVKRAYESLLSIDTALKTIPIAELSKKLNVIINTAHQTGSMLEHIENMYGGDINEELLDQLTNLDTGQLDWSLEAMGVLPEVDRSSVERRQTRQQASDIVRSAWRDLARRERMGNPVMSLQEAVLRRLEEESSGA